MSIAADLREALAAVGIIPDGAIGVRREKAYRKQPWIRAMFSLGGAEYDVHAHANDWPPAAKVASGLRWALDNPSRLVLNGSREMVIERLRQNRGEALEPPPEILPLP